MAKEIMIMFMDDEATEETTVEGGMETPEMPAEETHEEAAV